jgi:hypothetical protein
LQIAIIVIADCKLKMLCYQIAMREIVLSKGCKNERVALVDDEDYEKLSQFKWSASLEGRGTKWYAIRWKRINGKQTKIRMHHFVLDIAPGTLPYAHVVDHKNTRSLDNQKHNLQVITELENLKRKAKCKPTIEPYL